MFPTLVKAYNESDDKLVTHNSYYFPHYAHKHPIYPRYVNHSFTCTSTVYIYNNIYNSYFKRIKKGKLYNETSRIIMDVQVTWASMRPGMRQPACFSTARPASVASSMGHTARIRPSRMTAQCLDVLKRGRGYPWMGVNC